jgi:NAD(P)-dependent dehydrogenase (short-subunit alcohol dehydrogenase family)
MRIARQKLLLTGAAGGVGRSCARMLGCTHDLVLTDVAAPALHRFAEELMAEGYTVLGTHPGDLANERLLAAAVADLKGDLPFCLIHTAGVAPPQADWKTIMAVNLVATERLLREIEPVLRPKSVAILIASAAGYRMPVLPEIQSILDAPLAPDMIDRISLVIDDLVAKDGRAGRDGVSYSLTKQALLRLCELHAAEWGARGARIVTISPGLMLTPMGYQVMQHSPTGAAMRDANPTRRTGTAMDVALAARFLASEDASFITGCDLRIDGGAIASTRQRLA